MTEALLSEKPEISTGQNVLKSLPGSFRDPSGFLFVENSTLYRQVNQSYKTHYDHLMACGLYEELVQAGELVSHKEVENTLSPCDTELYKVIQPKHLPLISYPYEWSFSQLKDAALLTLSIQQKALERGMTLKDGTAYNIQFYQGKPLLIDTLSFEIYEEGSPWIAYRQFCQHFLAPLALMAKVDIRLGDLLRTNIDGVPLDLAATLLPWNTKLDVLGLSSHIHLHAKSQAKYADTGLPSNKKPTQKVTLMGLKGLIDSLKSTVQKLEWTPAGTEWGDYYSATNYSNTAFDHKKQQISDLIDSISPQSVWDLGANTGEFSRIASNKGIHTVAFDIDPAAVEKNYRQVKQTQETNILPLVLDLTNPSPSLGWANNERDGFVQRGQNNGKTNCVMALALIHHLAISNNVPLAQLADFFANICKHLIIEFVPKSDSQVKRLLSSREDIFPHYTLEGFEAAFGQFFEIASKEPVKDSERVLYLLKSLIN